MKTIDNNHNHNHNHNLMNNFWDYIEKDFFVLVFSFFCGIVQFIFSGAYMSNVGQAMLTAFLVAIATMAGKEIYTLVKKWYLNKTSNKTSKK